MEKEINFILSIDRAFYLLKHFSHIDELTRDIFIKNNFSNEQIEIALHTCGSKFSFCKNPFELMQKIKDLHLQQKFAQDNGTNVYIYSNEENMIGTNQLTSIQELSLEEKSQIKIEERNGFKINVLKTVKILETNVCVLVSNAETNEVISVFPGIYAPPFPIHLSAGPFKEYAEKFWNNHVFLKS